MEEEGKNGGEPARPLEKLEKRAQTSSSSCLTPPWGSGKGGYRRYVNHGNTQNDGSRVLEFSSSTVYTDVHRCRKVNMLSHAF